MKETKQLKDQLLKRLVFSFLVILFTFSTVYAQQKTVTGLVKDATGETIIGASVIVKGTTIGTVTGMNGDFKLNAPAGSKTLVISYVGMVKQEVAITSGIINVIMKSNTKDLDEVVVIGYGTQKKRDLTGSISTVGEKQLKDIPVSSVAEALTGKMAGVQVTTTEGSPDAEIKIRVRGGGSITQSNSPLYIVDGFAKDDIKDISPSEIVEVTVLKDASSSAIYGSRGANGVVLITTRSGSQGKMSLSYNTYYGFKHISKTMDVLTPFQFAQKQYERSVWNSNVSSDYENYFGSYQDINLYNYVTPTNWQNETFGREGFTQNHNLTLTGGTKTFNFNASYNHTGDKAIMYMSDYVRDNVSLKLNYQPIKWLKLDMSARGAFTTINGSGANDVTGSEKSTSDSRVKNAIVYTPIPLKNLAAQSDDAEAISNLYSPLQTTADNDRMQKNIDMSINGGFTININKNLTFRSSLSYTTSHKNDDRFYGLSTYYVREGGALKRNNTLAPAALITVTDVKTFQNTNTLSFKKDNLFKGHNLAVVLGQETYNRSNEATTQNIDALPIAYNSHLAWDSIQNGTNRFTQYFHDMDDRMISFFGRINYEIQDKYLLAVIFRTDGSSKFSGANKWGYFPSISAGWRMSEEGFMKGASDWLSALKLRVSYGEAGNNRINNSAFQRAYKLSNSNYLSPEVSSQIYTPGTILANPDLKWETTITRNVGLDFGFFKNRLNGSLEFYSNNTEGVLIQMAINGPYASQWQNAASTSNLGAELNLNAVLVDTKDFNLSVSLNVSANQNKVDNLGGLTSYPFNEAWTSYSSASNSYIVTPGNPVGLIYGYVSDGMYSASDFTWSGTKWIAKPGVVDNSALTGLSWGPGAMKLKDTNGDGKITIDDKTLIGNTNPKNFGAFSINATYKGFDANINLNWVYGNNIYNANKIELTSAYYKYRNSLAMTANSYTQIDWATGNRVTDAATLDAMNANATMWAGPTGQYATTSWAIEDGSFIRLNNVTLGYTLPSKLTKKFYVQKLRLYASGYNLAILTNYSGYDPEVDTRRSSPATPGVDYSAYPKSTSYNIGLNITF